ncbi:protein O-linked-mannose beta-1,4-N-acetylglucosaminyltransferase 2-like [Gigantopelta aegis]|uniref:protein O-linked-mannose beta-1,4-N-acetylglucosaminyltransferase 2-like n=1 Tax=Gigantopelta aegis TaxID=1735272 RepID=UPI001B888327|nr:protein O-linked-mannose beta-1,4-N-acetylglucosaminyltransferase 2-like [Gigantopelta aegis]
MTIFKLSSTVIIIIIIITVFTIFVGSTHKKEGETWPETDITFSMGHYPTSYCRMTNIILDTQEKVFKYRKVENDNSLKKTCLFTDDIWPFVNVASNITSVPACDVKFNKGHVFTMYYFFGSNYFHLHYDMMLPLYSAVHRLPQGQLKDVVFMPSVESRRLQYINWETEAFKRPAYWMEMLKVLTRPHTVMPLDSDLIQQGKTICMKVAYFGTPSIDIENIDLINSYVKFIKTRLGVAHNRVNSTLIGIISRSTRRKILNEQELLKEVSKFSAVEMVEFTGKTFKEQIECVQKYSVLVGVNGAGLTNAMFLSPGAVAVQLVPFNATVNYKTFAQILQCRGPYLEWHNRHSNLTHESRHDTYRSAPDTTVHAQEFVGLMKQALSLVNSDPHAYYKTEL